MDLEKMVDANLAIQHGETRRGETGQGEEEMGQVIQEEGSAGLTPPKMSLLLIGKGERFGFLARFKANSSGEKKEPGGMETGRTLRLREGGRRRAEHQEPIHWKGIEEGLEGRWLVEAMGWTAVGWRAVGGVGGRNIPRVLKSLFFSIFESISSICFCNLSIVEIK